MNEDLLNILNDYDVSLENNYNTNKSVINFPIYIINLNTNNFRRSYIKCMANKIGLNYTLVIVKPITDEIKNKIDPSIKNGILGCFLSHLWCIKDAISKKHEHFLILEDDIVFHKNFNMLFKKIDYKKYDMIQLGCCDFNFKKNIKDTNINLTNNNLLTNVFIYNPKHIALGAYGNIYNINFAKIVYEEKINNFKEFDTLFDMYYNKYNLGICLPNLITTELSTTNLGHNFSLFKESKSNFNYNTYFVNSCFSDFNYNMYYFIWIIFIEFCYKFYKENDKKYIDTVEYHNLIENFATKNSLKYETITETLNNNNIFVEDIMNIFKSLDSDNYC
jgi:GR25 family glycosyltransferase involved in LPS biosynthesis